MTAPLTRRVFAEFLGSAFLAAVVIGSGIAAQTLSPDDTGLATIYRVLTQFEQAGLLIRHHFETGKAVFELNQGGHHDHLVCVQCGHVEEFFDSEIEKRQEKVAKDRGFKIHDHSLHIYADCNKTNCPHRNR